ncbi:hypothetical protein NI343_001953 [Salmonella enterica]|nr:hypothetical protein [Salmonella enterica]EKC2991806.1 hypothetical protein [Salmonella enterica]
MTTKCDHKTTRVILTIENGVVIESRPVRTNEFTATIDCFVQILEKAGYIVARPHPALSKGSH